MLKSFMTILIAGLLACTLSSCEANDETIKLISAEPSGYKINLYSHPDDQEQANDYMSALLNWKTAQEDDRFLSFKESTLSSDDINISADQLPALVIYKDGELVQSISGNNSDPSEIKSTLDNTVALSNNKNS
ncbi:hypothetical protein [Halobacillus campisalis]|uniref:Small peptidoglycan-associated lipoprotein n=1 Tax=Halobacillus campisalis TaxID=435909 RepID=A0ABW2K5L9_9BACI|nr:hypothetical protein [Halobacillus campisalis]